jgi:transposase
MWILPHENPFTRYEWDKTLRETGNLISHAGKHPKQHVTEETVDSARESFSRSPRKSIRQASRELGVPRSTVHNIVHKRLRSRAYKLQLLRHIKPDDHRKTLLLKC